MISEPADAAVRSVKQMNSIPEGALLTGSASAGSQSLLAYSLLPSKADLQSLGTAAEILALTTTKVSVVLWEKDILGQVLFLCKTRHCLLLCSCPKSCLAKWHLVPAGWVGLERPWCGELGRLSHLCSHRFLRSVG